VAASRGASKGRGGCACSTASAHREVARAWGVNAGSLGRAACRAASSHSSPEGQGHVTHHSSGLIHALWNTDEMKCANVANEWPRTEGMCTIAKSFVCYSYSDAEPSYFALAEAHVLVSFTSNT